MIEVRRTSEPFESIEEMQRAFTEVTRVLDEAGRITLNLLVDTRDAPPRNDPRFEAMFEPLRTAMLMGFRKVAVLVRTAAGVMQVERHAKRDGLPTRAFVDEEDARTYCMRIR